METAELWYRAEDRRYADSPDECGESYGSHLRIELRSYPVIRRTPKGVVLSTSGFGSHTFVLGTAAKQFAVPTVELAYRDLVERKKRHVAGAKARLERAEEHLRAAHDHLLRHAELRRVAGQDPQRPREP